MPQPPRPRLAKAYSKLVADEYLRLGWMLRREFYAPSDPEPYEYLFEWSAESEPVGIDWPAFHQRHAA